MSVARGNSYQVWWAPDGFSLIWNKEKPRRGTAKAADFKPATFQRFRIVAETQPHPSTSEVERFHRKRQASRHGPPQRSTVADTDRSEIGPYLGSPPAASAGAKNPTVSGGVKTVKTRPFENPHLQRLNDSSIFNGFQNIADTRFLNWPRNRPCSFQAKIHCYQSKVTPARIFGSLNRHCRCR